MKSGKEIKSLHPSLETLALYSSGDLQWTTRWRVGRHVARCSECEQQVAVFRSAKAELKREASTETLTGFEATVEWGRLEREMLGNIAVGVAAARCIDKVGRSRAWMTRTALVAGLAVLFVAGWLTHIPNEHSKHLVAWVERMAGLERPQVNATLLRSTADGIVVRAQGATLTLMHPASAVVSLSGSSTVSARYIDEETGEVTITKVYAQ